jgi:very-short-patch-repair endonuclease
MENDPTSPNPSKGGESKVPNSSGNKKLPGYVTANLQIYKFIKGIREDLKKNPTEAEKIIWEYLRNSKTGYKIRRQHIIDNFVVDFVCLSKKVIIEIDGEIHLYQQKNDIIRTNTLNEKGYKVIRFTNNEVFANPQIVALKVKDILDSRKSFVRDE